MVLGLTVEVFNGDGLELSTIGERGLVFFTLIIYQVLLIMHLQLQNLQLRKPPQFNHFPQRLKKLKQKVPNLHTQLPTVLQWLEWQNPYVLDYPRDTVQVEIVTLEEKDLVDNQMVDGFVFVPYHIFITI